MTLLQDITAAALLGTERQPFIPPPAAGPLGGLLTRLPADPEAALLGAAAAVALAQRVGTLPGKTETARPAPCPPEDQPACSPRVAQGLTVMLGGKHREALPEMLRALAATGHRVPETLLPELLKAGRQAKDLRDPILSVLGRRGCWLAAQNRDWSFADQLLLETAESPEQVWQEGAREARLTALGGLRQSDPALGLVLLQSAWATETADDRAAFLAALETGLSPADEPFLEAALEDRGKEVRRQAADLLARLPQSAFVQRMIARAAPLLVGKRSLLGGFSLEITLPTECDKGMERDGIAAKSPDKGMGDRAWWLRRIVSAIPPKHWTETWRRKPQEILEAAAKTEWAEVLLSGWCEAVSRDPDAEWAEALVRHWIKNPDNSRLLSDLTRIIPQTPNSTLDALVLDTLHREGPEFDMASPAEVLLRHLTGVWSVDLSRAVVEIMKQRAARTAEKQSFHILGSLRQWAYLMPPFLTDEFARDWPEDAPRWNFWQPYVYEFITTLQFRHDLLQEISQETRP